MIYVDDKVKITIMVDNNKKKRNSSKKKSTKKPKISKPKQPKQPKQPKIKIEKDKKKVNESKQTKKAEITELSKVAILPTKHKMLTKQGYAIKKDKLKLEEYADLKEQLTVKPKVHPDYDTGIESYPVYNEDENFIYVPRYFGDKKFGKHTSTNIISTKIDIQFKGTLQEEQKVIVEICYNKILEKGGGVISVPCGAGKTVMMLDLICKLGLKALVIVPKSCLLKQTVERIQQFTTARVGIIRQNKVIVDNVDIIVGMIHSIALKDYDDKIFQGFGVVAYDECHRTPSRILSKAFKKIGAQYTIGLSATPRRKDGLIRVMFWNIGNIIFKKDKKKDNRVFINVINYDSNDKNYCERKQYMKNVRAYKPSTVQTMTNLISIENRNKAINEMTINLILENTNGKVKGDSYRKILILSERIEHLETLKKMFDETVKKLIIHDVINREDAPISGLYIGRMKQYELDYAAQSDVIYGSYGLAKEGLDIGDLNVLIMASPQKDIEQAVGRILRKQIQDNDIFPIVVDICDSLYIFNRWFPERLKFYEAQEYVLQYYDIFETELLTLKKKLLVDKKITEQKYLEITDNEVRKAYIIDMYGEYYYTNLEPENLEEMYPLNKYISDKTFENMFDIDYNKYVTKDTNIENEEGEDTIDDESDEDLDDDDDDIVDESKEEYNKNSKKICDIREDFNFGSDDDSDDDSDGDIFARAIKLKERKILKKSSESNRSNNSNCSNNS